MNFSDQHARSTGVADMFRCKVLPTGIFLLEIRTIAFAFLYDFLLPRVNATWRQCYPSQPLTENAIFITHAYKHPLVGSTTTPCNDQSQQFHGQRRPAAMPGLRFHAVNVRGSAWLFQGISLCSGSKYAPPSCPWQGPLG